MLIIGMQKEYSSLNNKNIGDYFDLYVQSDIITSRCIGKL